MVKPAIVALLGEDADRAVVSAFCRRRDWEVSFARTCPEAVAVMERIQAQILLLDRDLAGEDWKETMTAFASSSGRTCIMLISRAVDAYLWNEVVRNGGYEVLTKPLQEEDVSRVVTLAWSYWIMRFRTA